MLANPAGLSLNKRNAIIVRLGEKRILVGMQGKVRQMIAAGGRFRHEMLPSTSRKRKEDKEDEKRKRVRR
jgi:N-lysine methyltransferase SETD6